MQANARKHRGRAAALAAALLLLGATAGADAPRIEPEPEGGRCGVPVPQGWCGTGTGGLHVQVDGVAQTREFPLKHTDVRADVTGPVARVTVTQTFQNPFEETIEAVYVFPLPQDAAVNDLEMRLGDRVVRGLIERREEAQRIYRRARDAGHVAALLEQERPNLFTQSVANILPGNEISVTITYVETLDYEKGVYEFTYPMVVGPRFIPPAGGGDAMPAGGEPPTLSSGVRDAHRITPPYLPPTVRSGHDISVTVDWDAGIPVERIESRTHRVDVDRTSRTHRTVMLHPNDSIPNKDLVLRCRVAGDGPETGVLSYHDGQSGYLTVLLHPEIDPAPRDVTPKEMIFVLDCSGSMSGEPMAAAKGLVRHALKNVNAHDTFQILRFSTKASGFRPQPIAATPENVKAGLHYLEGLRGGGGTMMVEGIKAALDFPSDPDRLRIVLFLTDGYIGNEDDIFRAVQQRIGDARLFSLGVGSSPNRYLLDGLAREGRGEVQYFLPGSSVADEVATFYDRIRNPYLTDLELVWDGVAVEDVEPYRVPDLFDGRPLVVNARYDGRGRGELLVRGRLAGKPWSRRVKLRLPTSEGGSPAVGSLWARARIGELERRMLRGESADLIDEITRLGLGHRLVTKFTSFVAVEENLVVSNGKPTKVLVPLEMPEGASYEGVFGELKEEEAFRAGGPAGGTGRAMAKSVAPTRESLGSLFSWNGPAPTASEPMPDAPPIDRRRDRQEFDDGDRMAMMIRALHVALTGPASVRAGEDLELTVTFTNRGRAAVDVPDRLEPVDLLLRVLDGAWRETRVGGGKRQVPMRSLAAGETATFRIRIPADRLGPAMRTGVLHLVLEGARFGAADSERLTVKVLP